MGEAGELSPQRPGGLDTALKTVMKVSRGWAGLVGFLALASCVKLTHPSGGGLDVEFAVTATTLGVVALLWLPSLLRVWSLAGGKVEAAGVAATSGGLLASPEDLINRLTGIKTTAEKATEKVKGQAPEAAAALRSLDKQVDEMASEYLGGSDTVSESVIRALGRQYEQLRESLPPGDARTVEMTRVVNEARLRAEVDTLNAMQWAPRLITLEDEGRRIVGLAFLQAVPLPGAFPGLLRLVRHSATAFEMFHTLLAIRASGPLLSSSEKEEAARVMLEELEEDPRGVEVASDPGLRGLIREIAADFTSSPKSA